MLINHQVAGSGSPVLLLHSSVADLRMWDPQWPALTAAHRGIRADFRGYGQTPPAAASYRDADDLRDLLDSLDIARTAVVGASYGGRVAVEFAVAYPDRVSRLILLCAGYHGLPPTLAAEEFDATETALLESGQRDRAVQLNLDSWLGPEADDATRERVAQMQANNFEVLASTHPDSEVDVPLVDPSGITVPTLVVSGAYDMDHFRAIADHLAAVIPNARELTLPWAGHLPSLERPAEITQLLLENLD